jgi:hypothetical protein
VRSFSLLGGVLGAVMLAGPALAQQPTIEELMRKIDCRGDDAALYGRAVCRVDCLPRSLVSARNSLRRVTTEREGFHHLLVPLG